MAKLRRYDRQQRWRLMLGKGFEPEYQQATGKAAPGLTADMQEIDSALGAIYDRSGIGSSSQRGAGLEYGGGSVATWLGDIRKYFDQDVVALIQQDAIERRGWKQLLLEPETLSGLTPSLELVTTLLALKGLIPEETKATARMVVRNVVAELLEKLRIKVETAVRGALNRAQHQPLPSLPNFDWQRTIRANLKNYIPERAIIIPERLYFYARRQRRHEWNIIVCIDQSGSMAESVVYGSVMASIFASIPALKTNLVAFDTEVVDLTELCHDPVDILFGVQLGGGTDINRAIGYCEGLIENPERTLLILISDLYEGGNKAELVGRLARIVANGTRAVCLLALSDSGQPGFNHALAEQLSGLGIVSFGATPAMLPDLIGAALQGQDLSRFAR